jgi:cell wall-associated NlpC family hydrolase
MTWPSRYIGVPFDNDDANGGAHCWGLVRRVFAEVRGIALPAYGEISASDMVAMAAAVNGAASCDPWRAVPRGQEWEFDVAVMVGWVEGADGRRRREPRHVGIITADRRVVHVEAATAAVCVPLDHPSIRFRYLGAQRYVGAV